MRSMFLKRLLELGDLKKRSDGDLGAYIYIKCLVTTKCRQMGRKHSEGCYVVEQHTKNLLLWK
jgi:hypothetical protein